MNFDTAKQIVKNDLISRGILPETYWTFIYEGHTFDGEYDTKEEAEERAREYIEDTLTLTSSTEFYAPVDLIQFTYKDDGERVILLTDEDQVLISNWGSDYDQHNTMGR